MVRLEDVQTEALLAATYVVVLLAIAIGLERAARLALHRSDQYETGGFRYQPGLDAWECPMGEQLSLVEVVPHHRPLARYRARASVCNSCTRKSECTQSDTGRELTRTIDDWPRSDIAKFYRGLSLALVGLAVFITVVALVRNHGQADALVLGSGLVLTLLVGFRLPL